MNFETDSMLYPYDSQTPVLKLQSLNYGKDKIRLRTRMLNSINQMDDEIFNIMKENVLYETDEIQDGVFGFCLSKKFLGASKSYV